MRMMHHVEPTTQTLSAAAVQLEFFHVGDLLQADLGIRASKQEFNVNRLQKFVVLNMNGFSPVSTHG